MPAYSMETAGPTARVLIVEDDLEVLQVLVGMLRTHPRGLAVETARDGYEALIKVGAFGPSLLILDVVMPKLDGLEVCRRLRQNPETRHIRILAMTGRSDMVRDVIAAGADVCITKPVDYAVIDRELERFLGATARVDPPAGRTFA